MEVDTRKRADAPDQDKLKDKILVFLCICAFHYYANRWRAETETGRRFTHYLQNWRPQGWIHGTLVFATLYTWGIVAIMVMGLAPGWMGCSGQGLP